MQSSASPVEECLNLKDRFARIQVFYCISETLLKVYDDNIVILLHLENGRKGKWFCKNDDTHRAQCIDIDKGVTQD